MKKPVPSSISQFRAGCLISSKRSWTFRWGGARTSWSSLFFQSHLTLSSPKPMHLKHRCLVKAPEIVSSPFTQYLMFVHSPLQHMGLQLLQHLNDRASPPHPAWPRGRIKMWVSCPRQQPGKVCGMHAKFLSLHVLSSTEMFTDLADLTTSLGLDAFKALCSCIWSGHGPNSSVRGAGLELSGKLLQLLQLKPWALKLSQRG